MTDLSFHEKSTIGTLIALVIIGISWFFSIRELWLAGALHPAAMTALATGLTILLVAVLVAYHIVIAATAKPQVDDERDRIIAWRAGNIGGVVLGFGVIGIVVHILVGGLFGSTLALSPTRIAAGLMAAVFVATVVELVLTLVFYRRGV
jgi:hypothetical protein